MFGRTPPFKASNALQDEADAAALALFNAAKELVENSYEHDDKDGRGPNTCVFGYDLDSLKQAVANAEKFAAPAEEQVRIVGTDPTPT
jgi:hypothetical protein